jgi:transposase
VHRLRILQLRASRGWTTTQKAQRFLVTEDTIAAWMRRLDEEGEEGLVRIGEPINKYPDFVGYLVRRLKLACPSLGKVRIAQILARAGLHIGASTVGRMLKRGPRRADPEAVVEVPVREELRARKPVWSDSSADAREVPGESPSLAIGCETVRCGQTPAEGFG